MNRVLRGTSLVLFALPGAFLVWFGWVYATVQHLLRFHAAAVPEAARDAVRPLYLALMNLIGGASAGLGLLGLYVTVALLRQGDRRAAVALWIAYALPLVLAAVTAENLAAIGAPTSWHIMGVLLATTTLALAAHVASSRSSGADAKAPEPLVQKA